MQSFETGNLRALRRETGLPLVYVNEVGGQDELVFDGDSLAVAPDASAFYVGRMDGSLERFAFHRNPYGPLIELLPVTTRSTFERWMRGDIDSQ